MKYLLSILILLLPIPALAMISLDNATSYNSNGSALITHNFTQSVRTTNELLLVGISASTTRTLNSVSYNSIALTLATTTVNDGRILSSIWYLVNPSIGDNTVSIVFSGFTPANACAVSLLGVDRQNPIDNVAGATIKTVNITSTSTNAWVFDNLTLGGTAGTLTAGTGQGVFCNTSNTTFKNGSSMKLIGAPKTSTVSWANIPTPLFNSITAVTLKPLQSRCMIFAGKGRISRGKIKCD